MWRNPTHVFALYTKWNCERLKVCSAYEYTVYVYCVHSNRRLAFVFALGCLKTKGKFDFENKFTVTSY